MRMVVVLVFLMIGLSAAWTGMAASEENGSFRAPLRGFEEPPSISTAARGSFTARLEDESISYTLTYQNIEGGEAFAAHIHLGQTGVNGAVIAFLCGGDGKPPCPATGGTVTGVVVPANVRSVPAQGIAAGEFDELTRAMKAGFTYVNVHSRPTWLGGEIRGQIQRRGRRD